MCNLHQNRDASWWGIPERIHDAPHWAARRKRFAASRVQSHRTKRLRLLKLLSIAFVYKYNNNNNNIDLFAVLDFTFCLKLAFYFSNRV